MGGTGNESESPENIRDLVNGAQLPRFIDKPVAICGKVVDVMPGGRSFTVRTSDNMIVTINMKTELDKALDGYVEVHGISQGRAVLADDFIVFEDNEVNVRAHNAVCNFLYSVPNFWKTKSDEKPEENRELNWDDNEM